MTGDGLFRFGSGTVRFGDGQPIPVDSFQIEMAAPFAPPPRPFPLSAGSLENFGFGCKFALTPEGVEHWREISATWPVEPAADDLFADWRCPGCGAGWDEAPPGHSWSRGPGGEWSCRDAGAGGAAHG